MATPVFCCGAECGIDVANSHWASFGGTSAPTISTATFRGGLRSFRFNTSTSTSIITSLPVIGTTTRLVGRMYVYFATLPSSDTFLMYFGTSSGPGIRFRLSDNSIYAAVSTTLGASGFTVTTGVWYRLDYDFNIDTGGNDTSNVRVNGNVLGQATAAGLGSAQTSFTIGIINTCTAEMFVDDIIVSVTGADYPIGPGHIKSYIANADGSHNIAGANDFERSLTGTDITNATTTAWQLTAKRPLPSSVTDFINMVAPPSANDYVEITFEDSTEGTAPRTVEAIIAIHQAGTGAGNMEVRLDDNGVIVNIYSATGVAGTTSLSYKRAHYAVGPSGAAWNLLSAGNDGAFNNLHLQFGSPAALDVNPDQYLDAVMFEVEYAGMEADGGAVSLSKLVAAGSATHTESAPTATGAPTLLQLMAVASSIHEQIATGDDLLSQLTAIAQAVMLPSATGTPSLQQLLAVVSAVHEQIASGAPTLPQLTASGVGVRKPTIADVTPDAVFTGNSVVIDGAGFD